MNLLHLKYVVEVEKTGSITQAAENLYMNQPNLSKAIKELESSVGITIFRRTPKGAIPTLEGEEFLSHAKAILSQVSEIESICHRLSSKRKMFQIAVPRSSYIALAFEKFVEEQAAQSSSVLFDYRETNAMRAIIHMAQGEYNLAVIRFRAKYEPYFKTFLSSKNLHGETFYEFDTVALVSEKHFLAHADAVTRADLLPGIQVVHGDLTVPALTGGEVRKAEKTDDSKKIIYLYERASQFGILSSVTGAYYLSAPVPDEYLKRYGLVQIPLRENGYNHYKDMIISPKNHLPDELEQRFVDFLISEKNKL